MDTSVLIALTTAIAQLGVAAAAYRLGSKVAARQEQQDEKLVNHETRIEVLEARPGNPFKAIGY